MKTVLPGAPILPGAIVGLLGGGENARMLALAARRMGYRVHVYSPDSDDVARPLCDAGVHRDFDDLISVRQFASAVDVVTATNGDVPVAALEAAAEVTLVRTSATAADHPIDAEVLSQALSEFTVIGVRGSGGDPVFYPPIAIDRSDGEIDIARSPAPIDARIVRQAVAEVRGVLEEQDVTGIVCMDFVLMPDHQLLKRSVSPHPHISGLLTVDACVTGQFEQQLRAVCGLPLGGAELMRPAATARLSNAIWEAGEPDWASALALPDVKLHLYGGHEGHLTATAASSTLAKQIVRAARLALTHS